MILSRIFEKKEKKTAKLEDYLKEEIPEIFLICQGVGTKEFERAIQIYGLKNKISLFALDEGVALKIKNNDKTYVSFCQLIVFALGFLEIKREAKLALYRYDKLRCFIDKNEELYFKEKIERPLKALYGKIYGA